MRRLVAACAFVGILASVSPATHAAYTELSAANKLATGGIIVDQSANPADYRLGQNVLRQEAVGVAGRVKGVIPTTPVSEYTCKNVYSDVSEDWVCRAAELSAEAKIVDPVATGYKFNPARNVTRYEAMLMMMKASCLNPVELGAGSTHVDQTTDAAVKAGVIASASAFEPNRAATRGEVFLYAAELMDFAAANPSSTDSSIEGCEGDDEPDLCALLPELPGCTDDDDDDEPTTGEGGDLEASLSDESPESDNIPKNGRSVFTVFELKAGDADVLVKEIVVERSGNGSEDDFDKILLLEDGIPVSKDRSLNSEDLATFTNLGWVIKAGKTRTFAVEAQMNDKENKENRLNIIDIVTDGGDVSGLPVIGNEMLTINYTVSEVEFKKRGSATTVDVGDEEAILGEFKLTNSSQENKDVVIQSIRLENNGSADVSDLDNLMLTHQGSEISDRVIVEGDYVTFVFDAGFTIEDGDSRNFVIRGDILAGDDGDTYQFSLSDTYDLRGYEKGSAIGTTVKDTSDEDLEIYTVDAGRFSISLDIDSPSAEDFVRGTDDVVFLIAKVDAGQTVSAEGVKVYLTSSSTDSGDNDANKLAIESDLQNVRLMVNGSTVDSLDDVTCPDPAGDDPEGCYYDFDNDFELDDNDLIEIVANIDDNATNGRQYGFNIPAKVGGVSNFDDLEYVESGDNVAIGDISGSAVGKDMTIVAATVQIVRNDGYASEEFVAGVKGAELLKFLVDAGTSSDITVQRLGFSFANANGNTCDVDDFTGFKLYADGDQVGDTEDPSGTGTEGTLTFDGINLDIEANDQAQFVLMADTAVAASSCNLRISYNDASTTIDDVNGDDITPTVTPVAATFSDLIVFLDGGELTATEDGDSPDTSIFVANTNGNVLGSFNFYADNDDVELKDLYFENNATDTTKADGRITILHLMVDGQVVASASPIGGDVDFSDTGIIVPRNESVIVDLVADFGVIDNASKTGAYYQYDLVEVEARSVATGFTLVDADLSGVEPEGGSTAAPAGELTSVDAHILTKTVITLTSVDPISGDLTNGTKEVYGVKITADAKGKASIYSLRFSVTSSGDTTFGTPTLVNSSGSATNYDCGATAVAAGTTEVITCVLTGTPESISAGASKTLYLKGAVGGVAAIGDGLSVQMLQTATDFDINKNAGGAAAVAGVQTADTASNVHLDDTFTIVWSDVANGNVSDTAAAQWFGDNEVPGLDTATVTNKVD